MLDYCTTEDLLLYLYGELPEVRLMQIEQLLDQHWSLREKLQVLQEAFNGMENTPLVSPRTATIRSILQQAFETSQVNG